MCGGSVRKILEILYGFGYKVIKKQQILFRVARTFKRFFLKIFADYAELPSEWLIIIQLKSVEQFCNTHGNGIVHNLVAQTRNRLTSGFLKSFLCLLTSWYHRNMMLDSLNHHTLFIPRWCNHHDYWCCKSMRCPEKG